MKIGIGGLTFNGFDIIKVVGTVAGAGVIAGPIGIASVASFHVGGFIGASAGAEAASRAYQSVMSEEEFESVKKRLKEKESSPVKIVGATKKTVIEKEKKVA